MSADFYLRTRCRMCDGSALQEVMQLTATPPGNSLLKPDEIGRSETCYPLVLHFCGDCHHVQLGHVVNPRILFQKDYSYVSATSPVFVRHLQEYSEEMVRRFQLRPGALVSDIGSNDGTCLSFFRAQGMKVLGVDPATNIAQSATAAGIETIGDFFTHSLAVQLRAKYGPASFISSHNACAHIDDLADVVQGVAHWLGADGVFVLEVGYLADVYTKLLFDTIYHEHLDYHTVAPFDRLFARTGMELLSAQRIRPQGGSIRVMAQKAGGPLRRDGSIDELVSGEHSLGLNVPSTFAAFGRRIDELGEKLRILIRALRAEGKSIAAYGAPTKATTLLTHFGIGAESLDFVVEDNPLKQGLLLPLSHIPILPTAAMYERHADFVLILAWNFAEPIMTMHRRYTECGGRFILPMPDPRIV